MSHETTVVMTVRLEKALWKALRHLQEDGKIKSIQEACIRGLNLIISKETEK